MKQFITPAAALVLMACSASTQAAQSSKSSSDREITPAAAPAASLPEGADTAIFAGGCFWCVESDFEKLTGVYEVVSGYTGGDLQQPTYRNHGQHVEGAKVTFDPGVITYEALLDYYWRHIDPTDNGGQFCDRGHAYIPVIYARPDQVDAAEASKAKFEETKPFSDPVLVPILPAKTFWDAEDYHQDYYKKNPRRYKFYRTTCGRDAKIKSLWTQ